MTKEAKKKSIEIGAGLLLYIIAWAVTDLKDVTGAPETVMFLLAYAALSVTTYWEQLKRSQKSSFWMKTCS